MRGTLNEPGTVTVNSAPARMSTGNTFDADVTAGSGTNTLSLVARDVSGNQTTANYSVSLSGTGATYTYDANGNMLTRTDSGVSTTYTWDAENRLVQVQNNGSTAAAFSYDALGRRVQKVAGGVTTTWTYEGDAILRQVGGASTLKYIHGLGIDEALGSDDGTALTYLHADGLGSITKTTSAAGAVTLTRQYDAWGNMQAGGTTAGFAFTGREWDPETGLYYYRARYYDPKIARFLSEDPIGFLGGTVDLYGYVDENPSTFFDPSGLVKTGTKLKDPINTIACDGAGNIVVHIQPLDPQAIECGILTCLIVHETSHKTDAEAANASVCKTSGGFVPRDTMVVPSNESERVTGEARGTSAEQQCLRNKQKGCSKPCTRRIDRRLKLLDCFTKNNFNFEHCLE